MKTSTAHHRIRNVALWTCGLAATVVLAAFLFISMRIGADVRATSNVALQHYEGDNIEALIQYVDDTAMSFRNRNRAVWALGQLGDPRALAVLRLHYSGEPCSHDTALCQRELGKAIELAEGGMNVTRFVWRRPVRRRTEEDTR